MISSNISNVIIPSSRSVMSIQRGDSTSRDLRWDTDSITELFDKADRSLFQTVLSDKHHVLNRLLPASKTQQYNLRPRSHNLTLTCKSTIL